MLNKLILPALALGALGLVVALAESHGYSRAERDNAKQENKELQAAIAKRDELQAQINNMAGENAELVFKLKNAKLEGHKYVTEALRSNACNPLRGYISVLNTQRGYPIGTPDNPRLAVGEDAKPSSLTGERIHAELEQCEIDYRIAITRLNGLIDSVELLQ
jgi:hypothetical protein